MTQLLLHYTKNTSTQFMLVLPGKSTPASFAKKFFFCSVPE
jgi:hypothetical protein